MYATLLNAKRQEQLHELVPTAALVAMLVNPTRASTQTELVEIQAAADKIGQPIRIFNVSTDRELETVLATIVEQRIGGLIIHGALSLRPGASSLFFSPRATQFPPFSFGVNLLRPVAS